MEKCSQETMIRTSKFVLHLSALQKGSLSLIGFCITAVVLSIIRSVIPERVVIQPKHNNLLEEYLALTMDFGGILLILFIITTSFFYGAAYGEKKRGQS